MAVRNRKGDTLPQGVPLSKIGDSCQIQENSEAVTNSLADEGARRRIKEDLDRTFFVEAGAGSGKTKSLVDRMVALLSVPAAHGL